MAPRKPRFADTMDIPPIIAETAKATAADQPFQLSDPTSFELSREYHCAFGPIISASEGTVDPSSGTELLALSPFALETLTRSRSRPAHRVFTAHAARGLPVAGAGSVLTVTF